MWGRDVSVDYRNRQVSLKLAASVSKSNKRGYAISFSFDHLLSWTNAWKRRAFPHTNFVFLSFLLIGLPQNINPALSFKRCRSMSSCHFSIAFSAEHIHP